ncbi:glutamate-rich protein 3 isoform X7 [Sarcophilus harrisii]|uniref:glutamate-rich protein 3 isoform X7 n=1 Tax=Sarcophilus harrisii TaxID=9305 RepID=UPI001301D7A6|nr:glutamate-rich protein 3 isoform X7 [Sarcophilus harrisii]
MSRPHPPGPLSTYNSLTDKHLVGYFSNIRIRRHLQRAGLISRSGRILSEKEYRQNIMRKDHQKFTREYLAYAIFKKILEMEHNYQMELKRRLEATAQKERVQRVKVGRSRRAVEHYMPVLSPHPPVAPKANHGSCVVIDQVYSSSLKLALPRPNTAPGRPSTAPANMQQRPSRLQPLLSHPTSGVTLKPPSVSRSKPSLAESEGRFPNGGERYRNPSEHPHGVAPYQLPIINEYLMPVPPPPSPRNEKMINKSRIEAWRRRVRPTTAPNIPDPHRDSGRHHKSPLHSNAFVTMIYWGKSVHLNHDDLNYKDEIKIYQQHCGGENLCVFQGKLLEKETFQFISKRHFGFPFSLTFFLNGMQLDRLSSCCEFKHRRGSRLGGKNGYFGFVDIDGASPCYKCIISMGLDKKPFPPPKKEKEMMEVNEVTVKEEATKVSESFNEEVENVGPTPTTCSSPEDDKVGKLVEEEVERDQEIEIAIPANNTEASFRDDLKSIQEEIRESAEEDELRPSEAELNDSSTDEAQEGWRSSLDRSHKDGDLLAEETTALEMALEESKHVAPEGEQLKRGEAFEGVMIPEPKKAEPEAGLGGPRTRKRKEEEKEEVEVGEEGKKEEGEEEAEKEQEEEEEEVLGRGWMVVITTSTPRALAEVADLTKEREVVPKVHWEVEETGAKGEGFTSKEEEEVTERTRTSQIVTKAASPEEGSWKDKGSERKEAAIQEEKNVGKANKESQGDPGEVRHESKTAIHSEGRMEEMANQKEIEKLEEEEAEGERGCREAVSPSRKDMAAWREAPEMEELKGTKETIFKRKEMCPEEQKGGENAATLRGVSPVEKGADLEAGPPKGAEKETAAMGEEIMTEEETEPLNEIVREAMFQREAVTPLVTDEDKEIFEPLKETTNGKEDSEEKECESKKGGEKGVEPGDRAAFHRERAENENKLSAGEAASEVRESSGKAGSPGEKEEAESEDGDTGYGATGEVTCSAKGENEEEEQEMELPAAGVGRSPNNREGEPGDQGTPEEESTTLPERVETLGQIRAKGREPPAKTWPAALDDPGTPGEEAASAPGTGTPPKHERQEGEAVPEGPAEAEPGAAGGMAAAAPEREPLAEEGDPEENRASSPSDVAVGETWPRRDQLIKKTAAAGSGPVEEEGNGDWGPAGEEAGGKVAPETEPAAREGAFQRALVVQARKRDRDQKGGTVRKYWMRENGQAAEAGGGEGESTLGSQEPGPPKGGPKSQIPQATETMTVGKMAEIRRKQNSSARREGTDLRN